MASDWTGDRGPLWRQPSWPPSSSQGKCDRVKVPREPPTLGRRLISSHRLPFYRTSLLKPCYCCARLCRAPFFSTVVPAVAQLVREFALDHFLLFTRKDLTCPESSCPLFNALSLVHCCRRVGIRPSHCGIIKSAKQKPLFVSPTWFPSALFWLLVASLSLPSMQYLPSRSRAPSSLLMDNNSLSKV
jgi:hypothetical protein